MLIIFTGRPEGLYGKPGAIIGPGIPDNHVKNPE